MIMVVEAAGIERERASLPNKLNCPQLYQHPNKTHDSNIPMSLVLPTIPRPVLILVTPEVNAVMTIFLNKCNPFTEI